MPDAAVEPLAQSQLFQFGDRARRQPVTAGLVAGKAGRVDDEHVGPARAAQAAAADPAGPAPTTTTVGCCLHAHQYVGRMRTPATVVAGVDFGDAAFAATVRDGVARIEQLMDTELRRSDEVMIDSLLHLFKAGGKRFRPLFTVLSAQIGPNPDAVGGDARRRGDRADPPGDALPRRRDGRGGRAPRRAQRQRALGQQRRHSCRRLPVGDVVAVGIAAWNRTRCGIVADTFAELVTGQMRETRGAAEGADRVDQYLKVVHEKTGSLMQPPASSAACSPAPTTSTGRNRCRRP